LEEYVEVVDLDEIDLEAVDWEGGLRGAKLLFIG
jgi:hypothetical protein